MKRTLILHPFLFASYAVLALLANNIAEINLAGFRALLVSIGGSVLIVVLFKLIIKDSLKTGLISSAAILLIYAFGHIENITRSWKLAGITIGQNAILVPLLFFLFILWVYWVLRRSSIIKETSDYFNWVGLILNIFPIYAIVMFSMQSSAVRPWIQEYISTSWTQYGVSVQQTSLESPVPDHTPDIYYIILDAYTRSDVLKEIYSYDNSELIDFLKERGFYVADSSTANYARTLFSIASSLNMMHINAIPDFFQEHANADGLWIEQNISTQLIKQNRVSHILHDLGYTIVDFDSGFEGSRINDADIFEHLPKIESGNQNQIIFELLLLDSSIGKLYTSIQGEEESQIQKMFDAHRQRILFSLDNLAKYADQPGNYFVYAHVVSPHPPFVFAANGEPVVSDDPYTLMDAHPGQPENIELYRDQVTYLNKLLMKAIDQILSRSDTPPIIIIQGDHSSKTYSELNPPDEIDLKLHLPILNAYHLPGNGQNLVYPTITPVNTFRLLFNEYFGADFEMLEDKSYLIEDVDGHQAFVNACQVYKTCPTH